MEQENLEKLIGRSRAGDRQAQEQLVLAVQDKVYYHCRKMLKDPVDAQDTTQEILMAMLKGLDSLHRPGAFWSWLNRITSNTCCRWLSRGRILLWEDECGGAPLDTYEDMDDQTVPDRALDNEEVRRMVVELVEALPEAQRLSVLFYYYDEMSVKEIAEAMETSENTVKSRLHYAREAIRKGVDRYTAQGLQLYGLTPVPFLRYFLQKEVGETAAALAGKAALAASVGAAGAAASAAAGGPLAGLLGSILAHKGAAALVGLTLAGTITGGVLLHLSQPPAPERLEPSAALTETIPHTEPYIKPTLPPEPEHEDETPTPEKPEVTEPVWMGAASEPENLGPAPIQETVPLMVIEPGALEEVPTEPPEELPSGGETEPELDDGPSDSPDRNDRDDEDDWDNEDDGDDEPSDSPVREPDPEPEPPAPVVPEPVIPETPVSSVQYEPNPDFGSYLGETAEGVYEFIYTLRLPAQNPQPYPLLPGEFYSKMEISEPLCVGARGSSFYGIAPGESDVKYYVSESKDGPYTLKALAHVTVLRELPVLPDYDNYPTVFIAEGNVFVLEKEICADGEIQPPPLVGKGVTFELESSDPAVVGIRPEGDRFYGIAPGSAEVRVYARGGPEEPRELKGMVRLEVQPVKEPQKGTELCTPREDFSPENGAEGCREAAYQGVNVHGLYEFTATVREGDEFQLTPLAEASGYVSREIKNDLKVDFLYNDGSQERKFQAVEFGTTDIIFSVEEKDAAVVHVTVLPAHEPYYPNPDFGEYLGMDEDDVLWFRTELVLGQGSLPSPLQEGAYFLRAVSSDPKVVTTGDGRLYGQAPGSAEVRYYVSAKEEGAYVLRAVASVDVKPPAETDGPKPEPDEPEETVLERRVEDFGQVSGYGFSAAFCDFSNWGLRPSELEYETSDPAVICIDGSGKFTTLSAGTASLTARLKNPAPDAPPVCYRLTFQVQDHFDWDVYPSCGLMELAPGAEDTNIFSFVKDYYATLEDIQWSSSDESVATAEAGFIPQVCKVCGRGPGTAEITGTARISLTSAAGQLVTLTDSITFQVHVS